MLKFWLFNIAAFGVLIAAGLQHWLDQIWYSDPTYMSVGIFGLFMFGWCAMVLGKYEFTKFIAEFLVIFGMLGTVIGFIMALSGVDPETVGDASSIQPMVAQLIVGMGVALYTTLVGMICYIWTLFSLYLLGQADEA